MKATGVVRKVDPLGRIVLPIELRRNLSVGIGDSLEIYVESESIILKKYSPSCTFCEEYSNLIVYEGKNVCKKCLEKIRTRKF